MRLRFCWYDAWVGMYWDRRDRVLYVCPLPMIVFVFGTPKPKPRPTFVEETTGARVPCVVRNRPIPNTDPGPLMAWLDEVRDKHHGGD